MEQNWKPWLKKGLRFFLFLAFIFFFSSLGYVIYLRWFPPLTTPLMVMRSMENRPEEKVGTELRIRAEWVSYNSISSQAKLAVIASEDQRFANHSGFDYKAIQKAYSHNQKSKKVRGASTISQQVAKNVFLWSNRSWIRKGLEVYFTFLIETFWTKERILEMYLNIAELGDGVFGVEAASQHYYKKSSRNLSLSEAAMFAAVLPNPRKYSVKKPSRYVLARQTWIRRNMRRLGGSDYLDYLDKGISFPETDDDK
jgi:monofunctional biosynthetic peptidoglycan transglycosylase